MVARLLRHGDEEEQPEPRATLAAATQPSRA
jgi:hypothetical protein